MYASDAGLFLKPQFLFIFNKIWKDLLKKKCRARNKTNSSHGNLIQSIYHHVSFYPKNVDFLVYFVTTNFNCCSKTARIHYYMKRENKDCNEIPQKVFLHSSCQELLKSTSYADHDNTNFTNRLKLTILMN